MCKKILLTIQQHAIAEPIGISSLLWKSNDIRCAGPWLSPCLRICPSAIEMLCWKNAAPWDVECRIYSYEFGSLLRCVQCFPTNPLFCRKAQSINLWAFCACLESCIGNRKKSFLAGWSDRAVDIHSHFVMWPATAEDSSTALKMKIILESCSLEKSTTTCNKTCRVPLMAIHLSTRIPVINLFGKKFVHLSYISSVLRVWLKSPSPHNSKHVVRLLKDAYWAFGSGL